MSTDWTTASDSVLVVAVARWHQEALEELYHRHSGPVCALAMRLLNDRPSAEDVTQEVFLRLWHEPEKFDGQRGSLRTYLLTATHSRAVDLMRSTSARVRRESRTTHIETVIDDLEREVIDIRISEEVSEAFAQLPAGERDALQLTYFGGHTYREAARLLGQPEGTVKSRIRSGLQRLGRLLPESINPAAMEEL